MRSLCIPNSTLVHLSSKLSYVETHDFLSIKWGFLSPQFDLNSYFSVYTFFFSTKVIWIVDICDVFLYRWSSIFECGALGVLSVDGVFSSGFFFGGVKWGFIGVSKLSLLLNFYRLAVCNRNCHTFLDQS